MNLSRNFTLEEMTISQEAVRSGLKNTPTAIQTEALRLLCEKILEPLRGGLGEPIRVSSGYRSPTVNKRIGGSATSQHTKGQAVDFSVNGMTPDEIVRMIVSLKLPYDQLIEEFGQWTHCSYGPLNRRQVLKARRVAGKVVYSNF